MSESTQVFQLKFTDASVTAVYGSGQRQQVPARCVERSQLLSDLSATEHSSAGTPAPCPEEAFKSWMDLICGNRSLTAQELISALKAADVLIDEEGVFEASGILADRYLAPQHGLPAEPFQQTGSTSQPDREDEETCVYNAVEILDSLPQHLHLAVVRAAQLVMDVLEIMYLVPPSARPVALRACCPSIDSTSSLQLSCHDIRWSVNLRWAVEAAATLAHLQHLSINLPSCPTDEASPHHDVCIRHAINTIHSVETLRSLELSNIHVQDCSTADALSEWISSATALTKLRIAWCTPQHELQYPFAQCLLPLTRLQSLTLEDTAISRVLGPGSDIVAGVEGEEVEGCSNLEHLETASMADSENQSFQTYLPLGQVVHALSSLTELTISCEVEVLGGEVEPYSSELTPFAHHGTLSRIQVLRIVSVEEWHEDAATKHGLDQLLPHMPCLGALHIKRAHFKGFEGIDFSANSGLRFLDVRGNGLKGWDAQGTSSLCSLSALYLGENRISGQGVEILAAHFSALTSLQSLSFGHNGEPGNCIADSGAVVLSRHLSELVCLTLLGLRRCEIGHVGVCALASSLRKAPCLKALDIESNHVGAVGLRGLAQGLPSCTTLRSLTLGWCCGLHIFNTNEGVDQGFNAMVEVVGTCRHLSEVCVGLSGFEVPEESRPVLFSALGDLTALKSLRVALAGRNIAGLSELTRLVGLERLCLRHMWIRSDVPWDASGGKDWQQVLAACSRLTRLEFDVVVCEGKDPSRERHLQALWCQGCAGIFQFSFPETLAPLHAEFIGRMAEAIADVQSLKELVLRGDSLWPPASKPYTWQETLARVLPQMQSLTNLSFPVYASELQPCVKRAAEFASMRRGVTVKVDAESFNERL